MIRRPFKWGKHKAESNLRKHEVSFEEARTAFDDPLFVVFGDPDHSGEEDRFILMGESGLVQRAKASRSLYTERAEAFA